MPSIADKVYTQLRREIVTSRLKPGMRLQIKEWAEHFEVSATPMRDALQMLANQGLITSRSRSGFYVTRLTLGQLKDMLEMRRILEVAAVERAAEKISEAQLQELESVHGPYTGQDVSSLERYMDENRRFHYLLCLASGNRELAETVGRLLDRMCRYMVLYGDDEAMASHHAEILKYLRIHDPQGAAQAIAYHLDLTQEFIVNTVILSEAQDWVLSI
jgi:DNA-binding GntR family transcriptional regulator